jgi:hypothetical protein
MLTVPAEGRKPGAPTPDDPFAFLGAPFAEYARLLTAADNAKQRLHAAQIDGEANALARAELDYADALGAIQAFKTHGANVLLMLARFANELYPGALQDRLGFSREIGVAQDTLREHDDRIEELEATVANIATGEVVSL